jgi:hypothetical protein
MAKSQIKAAEVACDLILKQLGERFVRPDEANPSSRIGGFSRYSLVIDQRLRLEGLHYGDWFVDGG